MWPKRRKWQAAAGVLTVSLAVGPAGAVAASAHPSAGDSAGASDDGPGAGQWVVVREGDSLTSLAAAHGTTVAALVALNNIRNPDYIRIGQRLVVSVPSSSAGPSSGGSASLGSHTAVGWLPHRALSASTRMEVLPALRRWARHYGTPASLLEALTWWESGWQNTVVSPSGAVGIGQLEPDTVALVHLWTGHPELEASIPDDNVRMSAAYLAWLLERTGGDRQLAVAAYYQGLASVQHHGMLAETRHYVSGIMAFERQFRS